MNKSTRKPRKRGPGRPVVGPIFGFRLPPELVAELDAWAARQPDKPNRSDALRRLITEGIRS
jgi:hypothetical protein